MGKYCVKIPRVRNSNNELVDSRLYSDLLSYTNNNRSIANEIYFKTKNPLFKENFDVKVDENNEPLIQELIKKVGLENYINEGQIVDTLQKQVNADKKLYLTPYNLKEVSQSIDSFNTTNPFKDDYVAILDNKESVISPKIVRKTTNSQLIADQIGVNNRLNNRLTEILKKNGIGIGILNELDYRNSIKGVVDFDSQTKTAEGLIELIRLAEGKEGQMALPEEFSHILLASLEGSPIYDRLMNNLQDQQVVQEILGDQYEIYDSMYKGDQNELAFEAAGKLLSNALYKLSESKNSGLRNIVNRAIQYIKDLFSNLSANDVRGAIIDSQKVVSKIAKDILQGEESPSIELQGISRTGQFYQAEKSVNELEKLLNNLINNSYKRLTIYSKQQEDTNFSQSGKNLIATMENDLKNNEILRGVNTYLTYSLEMLKKSDIRLEAIDGDSGLGVNQKAGILREANNFIKSFESVSIDLANNLITDPAFKEDNEQVNAIKQNYKDIQEMISLLNAKYVKISTPLFKQFLAPYIGDGIEIPFGKYKGEKVTLDTLMDDAFRDITIWERYLDSMADSTDVILSSLDYVYKQKNELARYDTIEDIRQIKSIGIKLEQSGIKDTAWMIEKQEDGTEGYNYISPVNFTKYYHKRKIFLDKLKAGKPSDEQYNQEIKKWNQENSQLYEGKYIPKFELFENKEYTKMMKASTVQDKAKKEYYEAMMDMKQKLESYLPVGRRDTKRRIYVRSSTLERARKSSDINSLYETVRDSFLDNFIDRSDDTEIKEKATLFDFNNREVLGLPIFYTNKRKGEPLSTYSTDVTDQMMLYSDMANRYKRISEIIHIMELGRDLIAVREVNQTSGGKELIESIELKGKKIINKFTRPGSETKIAARYDDFMQMQIYKKNIKSSGNVGKLSVNKMGGTLMFLTSLKALGINLLQGTANIMTGLVMGNIEAVGGQYFKPKNLLQADKAYMSHLVQMLGNLGNRVKTDKLSLWMEHMNVTQDYESAVKNMDFYKRTWFGRLVNTSSLFFLSSSGEHWLAARTSLAISDATKMKDKNGNEVSLFDAFEVEYLNPNNPDLGAKLVIKDGYTKLDGSNWTLQDDIDFSLKTKKVNRGLNGTYNEADKSAAQSYILGRILLIFRKWMRDYWNTRYARAKKSFELDEFTEGYYQASGRFLHQLYKDAKELEFNWKTRFSELDVTEQANIRKTIADVAQTLALLVLIAGWFDDDDYNIDGEYGLTFLEYQARRLLVETGGYSPFLILGQGKDLIKSPSATFNTVDALTDLTAVFNPYNYEFFGQDDAIIQSGRFKGKSKARRAWERSPFLPIVDNINKVINPDDAMAFFKK